MKPTFMSLKEWSVILRKSVLHSELLRNSYPCYDRNYSTNSENPFQRTFNIIKDDFVDMKNRILRKPLTERKRHLPTHCDVLIIGGGVVGSSVAFWLQQRALDGLKIVVIEKDPSVISKDPDSFKYQDSSTVLSVGGLRQQFSLKENIELSLSSAEFLRNIKYHLNPEGGDLPDIQFNPGAYLFLATQESTHILEENAKLQRSLGAKVQLLSPPQLKEKFKWLNVDNLALGCIGLENEGWFDPWSLLCAFKKKALSLGTEYVKGEVVDFSFKEGTDVVGEHTDPGLYKHVEEAIVDLGNGKQIGIKFGLAVIAAGPFSGHIGHLLGMGNGIGSLKAPLPVEPRKRYVYSVHCPEGPGLNSPLLIDPSGTYFRRDGLAGNYLCGRSPTENEEPPADNLEVDYNFFETHVWPVLAYRVPAFEKCKLKSAWAGYYDFNTFDENAFVGPHPGYYNIYLATGFSGHGIQQAPAVGRAIMELIVDGHFVTVDLSRLGYERYLNQEPLWESNIV